MAKEEALREAALALHQHGKSVSEIARELNRSRQWVYKWLERYSSGRSDWSSSISNAPQIRPSKTSPSLVDEVKSARLELEKSPHHESGAYAIIHHLKEKGIDPPSVATINRILKQYGLVRKKVRYKKSGLDYPEAPINLHVMDLIGPCYLRGGTRYYLLTIISNDTRHAGVYPILSKSSRDVTRSVVSFWKSYSLPDFLQMDNELSFKGSNRHPRGLGLLLRTAIGLNVTPIFIPVSEPWRNGVIERFNQKVERTLLLQEHKDFDELLVHSKEFMEVHNQTHHYSTLSHKTPHQLDADLGIPVTPLRQDYEVGERPQLNDWNLNEIHFIRLVRSDLKINVLNTEIHVSPKLQHTYVDVCLLINEHRLLIRQDGITNESVEFIMPLV